MFLKAEEILVEILTGRRGDVDGLIDIRRLPWSTLVAGGDAKQIFLSFNYICYCVLQVQDASGHLEGTSAQ